jgi:N-acetylglucosamine kinase-like BadF-type ATPase
MSGLRAALRAHDGRGQPSMLCHSAAARFGKLEALPALIEGHENPARLAATFAGDVYRDAVSGDPVAYGLIQAASRHMAETAIAAGMRLGSNQSLRFAAIGGLLNLGTLLTDPLHDAIRQALPWLQFGDANGTSLDGAFLLATDRGTVHESSLARHQPHQEGETLPP